MASLHIQVRSGIDIESEPIRLIEVAIVCGDERRDVILDRKYNVMEAVFTYDGQRPPVQYHYRAYAYSGPFTQGPRSSFEAPPRTTDAEIIVVDPRELYQVEEVRAVSMVDPEQYRAAFVDVKVEGEGWSATETLQLTHDAPENRLRYVTGNTSKVATQHRIRYVTRPGAVIEGAWQATEPGTIIVGNPATTAAGAGV